MNDHTVKPSKFNTLRPLKHKQLDFFVADLFDFYNFRNDFLSMEHPFFALKAGDTTTRVYKNEKASITVIPNSSGMATIFDKDLWIYAISKLQQAIFEEQPISRTIRFSAYDFFITANRDSGGKNYKQLQLALDRLSGTRIKTNIKHSEISRESFGFGLLESWRIIEQDETKLERSMIEMTLPDWLYTSITSDKVLKISADYFRIRKAIDRRIYELARKHCGYQSQFEISIEKLHIKSGSSGILRKFRMNIRELAEANDLPDYEIFFDSERDMVKFKNRDRDSNNVKISEQKRKTEQEIYKIKKSIRKKVL